MTNSDHLHVDVLDGAMITLATFTLNFLYPGILLGHSSKWISQGKKGEFADHDTVGSGLDHRDREKVSSESRS